MFDPLGLSIGTTNLVAVRHGTPPVTRHAVLTLFPHRAPELGVPAKNLKTTDTGTLISGFVERIGGSNALVSADGSTHDPALLLVEALDAMISATGGDVCTSNITIAVPAHWGPEALRALQDALRTDPGFVRSGIAPRLVSDAVAALTALNSDARLPANGVVGLLDFGGGGTSITLADAASGFAPIAETIRCPEFSGAFIDQALLFHVLDGVRHTNGVDPAGTAVVGQLAHLSEECRRAKERLSDETVTELVAELPKQRAHVRVSRAELENLIEARLNGVFSAFDDMLRRNRVRRRDLAAVAMAGGVARIPLVAQRLSSHVKASVVTAVQPALAMAVGAVMLTERQPALEGLEEQGQESEAPTAIAAMAGASTGTFAASTGSFSAPTGTFSASTGTFGAANGDSFVDDAPSETLRGLAWSQADDADKEPVLYTGEPYDDDDARATPSQYLPTIEPIEEPQRRYHLPQLVLGIAAVVAMIAIGAVAFTLTSGTDQQAPPAPTITTVVPPLPPASTMPPSPSPLPPPSIVPSPSVAPPPTSVAPPPLPPPPPVTTTYQPPITTQQATTTTTTTMTTSTTPRPTTTTTTMTTSTTPPPTTTSVPPTTITTTVPMTTEYLRLPFVPVPIPVQVPEGQGGANQPQNPYPQNPFLSPGG